MNDGILGEYRVFDIETYFMCALFSFYNPKNGEWKEFEISEYRNDLYAFVKWYKETPIDFHIGFNNLNFDTQVIEYVLRNYDKWYDLDSVTIARSISIYASNVIYRSNNRQYLDYREWDMRIPQIDLFKIWHYDRDQKGMSAGLKKLEYSMSFETIDELPYDFKSEYLSEEQIAGIRAYCRNDVLATHEFLKYTLGDCEHSLYKEDNKIELRMTLKEEFKFYSLNISDTKIGESIIKKEYCKRMKIHERDFPKKGTFRKEIPIRNCIPPSVKFKTPQLQQFLKQLKSKTLTNKDEFSETVHFCKQIYDFKKGGLHNRISGVRYEADDEYILLDLDVTGYYTWVIINNEYCPAHLNKKAFIGSLKGIADKRSELKPLAKKDKRIAGIIGGLKRASLSIFGKTGEPNGGLYDRQVTMQTTITGQLWLLMLIESLELVNIHVVMTNTDGIMIYTRRENLQKIRHLYKQWQSVTNCIFEETEFDWIAFSNVNHYMGKKSNGDVKVKGNFLQDSELHGNKSKRIVRIALYNYFLKGVPVEDTILNHQNIYDFDIGVKSSDKFHYELFNRDTRETETLKKLVRYYISRTGNIIFKVENATGDRDHCESEDMVNGQYQPLVTYFNRYFEKPMKDYLIDYNYYILQCQKLIYKIESNGKDNKKLRINPNQLSLFS